LYESQAAAGATFVERQGRQMPDGAVQPAGETAQVSPVLAGAGAVKALAHVKSSVAEPGRELTIVGRDGMLAATALALPGEQVSDL
jgi:hypothetical protein